MLRGQFLWNEQDDCYQLDGLNVWDGEAFMVVVGESDAIAPRYVPARMVRDGGGWRLVSMLENGSVRLDEVQIAGLFADRPLFQSVESMRRFLEIVDDDNEFTRRLRRRLEKLEKYEAKKA